MAFAKSFSYGPGLSAGFQAYQAAKQARADAAMKERQMQMSEEAAAQNRPIYDANQFDKEAPDDFKLTQPQAAAFLSTRQNKENAANEKRTAQGVAYANQFRDEFNQLSKPFQTIVPMYQNIKAAAMNPNPTPQSDMGLIFAYMKILDPTSTVREGEYATAQNAGSIPDSIRNQFNKLKDGDILQPGQRIQFANAAKSAFKSAYQIQKQHMGRYEDLSKRRGVDPRDVTYDYAGELVKDLEGPDFEVPADPSIDPSIPTGKSFNPAAELARVRALRGQSAVK